MRAPSTAFPAAGRRDRFAGGRLGQGARAHCGGGLPAGRARNVGKNNGSFVEFTHIFFYNSGK